MIASDIITIPQAAEILGVHWQTIRNYIKEGKLSYHRIGKLIRIKRSDLESLLTEHVENKGSIEIEQRYFVTDRLTLEKQLIGIGANVTYQSHVIDHWFIPNKIKTREQHDSWFDSGKGCGVRIREQDNGYTGKVLTSLETKKLTNDLNHNTFLEGEISIENYTKCKFILEMMDMREFITIDKDRVMYSYTNFKISIDKIKDFRTGIEIEINNENNRENALLQISKMASNLGLTKEALINKSLTVEAMDTLAIFDNKT